MCCEDLCDFLQMAVLAATIKFSLRQLNHEQ
jgi:hypothetical protein